MDWTYLGPAMWLAEAAGLRLLFDPAIERTHHGGVFEVWPPRTVRAETLRADFIFVSHRHPDHFDIPSLHRLARLDPQSVVITPDPLVARSARALGFQRVEIVGANERIELDGVRMVTTPSIGASEWGIMVATEDGVVWNQVDSVLEDVSTTLRVVDAALGALGASRIDLGLMFWCPLLEVAAPLGHATGFPEREYVDMLNKLAAAAPAAVVPSAAGVRHTRPWSWMNAHAYPISEDRFLADVARLCPHSVALSAHVGGLYRLRGGTVTCDPSGGLEHIQLIDVPADDPGAPRFSPLDIPRLVDVDPARRPTDSMKQTIESWIHGDLAAGLCEAHDSMGVDRPLCFVVLAVFSDAPIHYSIEFDSDASRVTQPHDAPDDWDALNAISASMLVDVIEGVRHWGDALLAGALRCRTRAYGVAAGSAQPGRAAEVFLYYGLAYEDSQNRSIAAEIAALNPSADVQP